MLDGHFSDLGSMSFFYESKIKQASIVEVGVWTMQVAGAIVHHQKTVLFAIILCLFTYFAVMDIMLYQTFMSVNLVDEKPASKWSPFRPLSMKLLMTDHFTHYVVTPLSESFNDVTKFSQIFYFVTPNMITFTHLTIAFISGKFIVSESLHSRRIGVLFYEFRSFLDAFDGTVFRARQADKSYKSHHSDIGFWIDSTCDTIAGFVLCFSILFCLWWKSPPKHENNHSSILPSLYDSPSKWTNEKDFNNGHATENHSLKTNGAYSQIFIFWRVFCFGGLLGFSSAMWDQSLEKYEQLFMTKLGEEGSILQSQYLHSTKTWILIWLWRVLEGQALLQMVLCAVFIDKVWEFFRFVQYTGFVVVGLLVIVSYYHLNHKVD